ncbi:CBX4 ligase, partial [Spizella passerina]|nr:CBX4 ligase [Spizella passerina]
LAFALQLPSFARRSNILTGLQEPAVDTRPKLELGSSGKSQQHQYELNSKKHHQYQPNGKESAMKHQSHSKGKYYYQLNSKKHHHYQPDPKMYEPHYQPSSKEPQGQACLDNNKAPLVAHPDKWAHGPAKNLLGPVKNLTAESKNGAEKNLGSSRKRCLSEPHAEREPGKKRLTSRSISAPTCLSPPRPEPPGPPEVILLDSDLDEPIDLRCVKPRPEGELALAEVKPELPPPPPPAEEAAPEPPQPQEAAEEEEEEEAESLQEFKPFFGNIIITDVTANCLTVTFKEYVTV